MNGCGGESIVVEVIGDAADDYDTLVTAALAKVAAFLPGCAIQRRRGDCGGVGGLDAADEWYVGCAHARVSPGGQAISGIFTFVRHGGEAF